MYQFMSWLLMHFKALKGFIWKQIWPAKTKKQQLLKNTEENEYLKCCFWASIYDLRLCSLVILPLFILFYFFWAGFNVFSICFGLHWLLEFWNYAFTVLTMLIQVWKTIFSIYWAINNKIKQLLNIKQWAVSLLDA